MAVSKTARVTVDHSTLRLLVLVLAHGILFGCVTRPLPFVPFAAEVAVIPRTVAVMPLDNQTNSVAGAIYVRRVMWQNLERKGYIALPLDPTDLALAEQFGLSLGGQITEEVIPEIGRALEVDAVLTGTLQHFGIKLSSHAEEEVEAAFALYETSTGKKLWEAHKRAQTNLGKKWMPPDAPNAYDGSEFFAGMAAGILLNAINKPLAPAVFELVEELLVTMPNGAGSLHPNPVKIHTIPKE